MTKAKVYESVWDAVEADPAKAENLKLRSALMSALIRQIKDGA
jgi:predicted XRE-type DNA-binding protein